MRKLWLLFLAGFACSLCASEATSSPTAVAKSLAEAAPFCESLVRRVPSVRTAPQTKVARREVAKKLVSKMPVVSPPPGIDPKMPIKVPDPSIDHKLIVKAPEIESVK